MLRRLCLYILQFFHNENSNQDIKPIIQIQMENTLCELCNEREQLSELPCKHKICKGCLETQKLYTIKSCFICENKNWSELPSTFF
jgi:hypothetical protein